MDTTFKELIQKFIIIYIDDLTIFSKVRGDHPDHSHKALQRCQRYGISLNPEKCVFGVAEGKLLGHIIFERGISIDPGQVETLLKLQMLGSKKEIRSFFRKINFVMKFITGFAEIVKPLNEMMKKYAKIEWNAKEREAFAQIRKSIVETPILTILYLFTYILLPHCIWAPLL